MIRIIVFTSVLFYVLASSGQNCHCPEFKDKRPYLKNELGLKMGINLYRTPAFRSPALADRLGKINFITGINYKRHFNRNAIQLGLNYYFSKFNIDNYYYKNEGQGKIGELKIGYERIFTNKKLQLYYGADLSFATGRLKAAAGAMALLL